MARLEIILDNLYSNPRCDHGPTVLFHRKDTNGNTVERYYACAASRDGKCPFRLNASKANNLQEKGPTKSSKLLLAEKYAEVRNAKPSQKSYCIECQQLVLKYNVECHRKHKLLNELSEDILRQPTRFLAPLSKDGNEAQYFFNDSALDCIESVLRQLGITKVVCLGAPRLHEHLLTNTDIKSLLLDIDDRFQWFYDENHYLQYNMFNNYFFGGQQAEEIFISFLNNPGLTERVCIFTDPPFGCRTELLAKTIRTINELYNSLNSCIQHVLATFWIFPYFMEAYVQKEAPAMEMVDYHVNYTNHKTYHDGEKGLKHGSPVRIFTNVPLDSFQLPAGEGYRHCDKCNRSVHKTNRHCSICGKCPSKNGATYKHCPKCNWCVKPNYRHCNACGRCAQVQGHECGLYRKQIICRICRVKGHVEKSCRYWVKFNKKKMFNVGCFVCGNKGHTVSNCEERKQSLKETYFLNQYCNIMNSV